MGSALETLCGQAYGAGQIHMLGIYMQRSIIILFATCILVSPLYIFATSILKLVGQQEEIANLAGVYTLMVLPQLCSLAVIFPTQKFLQAQSKVTMLAWTGVIALISHSFLCWLFIYVFGWGATGASVAFDLSGWGTAIAQLVYVVGWCKDGWRGFSWSAFQEIWAFVRLSLECAIMLCLEIWYMMCIIILTGHLDNAVTAVGSLSICMTIDGWEAMFFIGVNAAVSVRVSNELGMGRPRAAKYSVYVTILQSLVIGILCMVVVLATRKHFSVIFTDSKEMQQAVAHLSPLLGITMLLNSIQPVISGTYRLFLVQLAFLVAAYIPRLVSFLETMCAGVAIGGGWQGLVAYINLACYYIFGLPLGYFLGYVTNLGVVGLWGGMIAGIGLQTLLLLLVLYKTNWSKEVEQTTKRMLKWGGQDIYNEKPSRNHLHIENGRP
ncbi:protein DETOXIFICATION 35-like isoform X3 [Primulina eburnea]